MQRRDHNFANEFTLRYLEYDPTSFEEIGTYYDEDVAWTDANGLAAWEQLMADPQPDSAYVYDAWQRLVSVTITGELRAEYEYNGLNWRIVSVADTDQDSPNFTLDQRRIMYYDNDWRLLEERINDNDDVDSTIDRIGRYVWGVRYIDDLVARDMDRNADGDVKDGGDNRYFAITDRNFSVIGMIDDAGALIERVRYTPYGEARHRWGHDTDEDGDVDTDDDDWAGTVAITSGGFQADRDIDRDGDNDADDRTAIAGSFAAALGEGITSGVSTTSGIGSLIEHRGHVYGLIPAISFLRESPLNSQLGRSLVESGCCPPCAEVRLQCNRIPLLFGAHHCYVLIEYPNGDTQGCRGGPQEGSPSGSSGTGRPSPNCTGCPGLWGYLATSCSDWNSVHPDWPYGNTPGPGPTARGSGPSDGNGPAYQTSWPATCDQAACLESQFNNIIPDQCIQYNPFGNNSNTAASEALRRCFPNMQIPNPNDDGIWAPGWNHHLPPFEL